MNERRTQPQLIQQNLLVVYLIGSLTVLTACTRDEEYVRVTSPSGEIDAVVRLYVPGSALGSTKWKLQLVSTKPPFKESPILFSGQNVLNFKLHWVDDILLEIRYDRADINLFSNYWSARIRGRRAVIELRLVPRDRIGRYAGGVEPVKGKDGRISFVPREKIPLSKKK